MLAAFGTGYCITGTLDMGVWIYVMLAIFFSNMVYCIYMITTEIIRRKKILETMAANDMQPFIRYAHTSLALLFLSALIVPFAIPTSSAYINLPNTSQVASSEARLYDMYNNSDLRVANTDFIRCRSLSLSYDFTSSVLSALHLSRLTLKASMTNPFLWARDKKWKGIDPETGNWPTRRITSLSIQAMF